MTPLPGTVEFKRPAGAVVEKLDAVPRETSQAAVAMELEFRRPVGTVVEKPDAVPRETSRADGDESVPHGTLL
jgi:hypothetical protein